MDARKLHRAVFAALQQGGERIAADARANVSRDTGELAGSISVEADPASLSVRVTASAPHAADVEFGNSRREERPFLRPALERNRAGITRDVARAARRFIIETLNAR